MKRLFKYKAFTLAEVLVTLGIIGVVSAMTVPTLMQNHQRKVYVTQLHKVYSEVGQAVKMYMTDNNLVSLSEGRIRGNKDELNKFVKNYFKVVKDCGGKYYTGDNGSCFAHYYTSLDGTKEVNMEGWSCYATVVLASGAALCFDTGGLEMSDADVDLNGDGKVDENDQVQNNGANAGQAMGVEVDINGTQGPNISGRDYFYMDVTPNGLVHDSRWTEDSTIDMTNVGPTGIGKIIEDGWQMTY